MIIELELNKRSSEREKKEREDLLRERDSLSQVWCDFMEIIGDCQ